MLTLQKSKILRNLAKDATACLFQTTQIANDEKNKFKFSYFVSKVLPIILLRLKKDER